MADSIEKEIIQWEERLKQAMLDSDVEALDVLLAPDLLFTNHLGQVLTKQDDLEAHRSGLFRIDELTAREQRIELVAGVAIVSVRLRLVGSYAGARSEGDFRFTRVWAPASSTSWHVVAGHSCIVV